MTFDNIIANPPYAKIGCDITKKVIEQNPDSNYAMLGTRSMFKPFYADTLACAFVQIGRYELGSNNKLDWGVEQAILLATNGCTEVVDNRKKVGENKVGINQLWACHTGSMGRSRTSHLVGTCISPVTNKGYITGRITEMCEVQGDMRGKLINGQTSYLVQMPRADTLGAAATHRRSTTLVGVGSVRLDKAAFTDYRTSHLVQVNKSEPYLGAAMDRHTANVTDTKPTDVKLRNGYIYVSFETFEEACECAIDIISWKNPTDSHYGCIRWGFVTGLVPHYK